MKALVVGGTGPTGPFIVNGLIERGYEVTIFHRGTHEIPELPPQLEHIHGDPHFRETIDETLGKRTFDLAVVTYGRIRFVAEALVGKVGRFVGVGGVASYRGYMDAYALFPPGLKVAVPEDAPVVDSEEELRFAYLIAQTEQAVLETHPTAAYFRYPYVYGPYQLVPREWSVIRRILDKRPYIILPDAGLMLFTHGYAGNLAHAVLLAVDQPEASAGQLYNCGDEQQLTLRQVVEVISKELDYEWDIVSMPHHIARPSTSVCHAAKLPPPGRRSDQDQEAARLHRCLHGRRRPGQHCQVVCRAPTGTGWGNRETPQDPFNYEGEDRLVAAYRDSMARLEAIPFEVLLSAPTPTPTPRLPARRATTGPVMEDQ